jgi:hypothetical protein
MADTNHMLSLPKPLLNAALISSVLTILSFPATASFWDLLGMSDDPKETQATKAAGNKTSLSSTEIVSGLKQALEKSTDYAVSHLGKENGFLHNDRVRIPLPENLQKIEKVMRSVGASKYADEFLETMNHAAEKAIAQSKPVFTAALKKMSIQDGLKILNGPDNAATQYFKQNTESTIIERVLPITKKMTDEGGVTASYKNLIDKLGFAKSLIDEDQVNLDQYITLKAVDGLFKIVEEQEKLIRNNPVQQTTRLLQQVFGKGN